MTEFISVADLGSNSFHFALFKIGEDGNPIFIEKNRITFRLSDFKTKRIEQSKYEEGIKILDTFKSLALSKNAPLTLTGTSALRESSNGKGFIETVEQQLQLKIKLLSGEDESRFIYFGVHSALPQKNKILCFDIGGGSTEIIWGEGEKVIAAESYKLGAVRLSSIFFPDFILTKDNMKLCREHVKEVFCNSIFLKEKIKMEEIVGTAGTAVNLLYIIKQNYSNEIKFSQPIPIELVRDTIQFVLSNQLPEQRRGIKGMDEKRAEIIPAGLIIMDEIINLFEPKSFAVTQQGLREGIALNFIRELNRKK